MEESTVVVSELEGTLLKDHRLLPYFILVAFESSAFGLLRFTALLLLWPLLWLLEATGLEDAALQVMVFVSVAGMKVKDIESVSRAVLPKFYMDDISPDAWRVFSCHRKRVVVTRAPRVMVEVFLKPAATRHHQGHTTRNKNSPGGVLFVCNHRTIMDPLVLSIVLGRRIASLSYSISRLTEILSPIPTVRLTRVREIDAERIKHHLSKGDIVVCPEGTTCREPFLLRFSALFAKLTDRIVPVALDCRVGFFYATTAGGWKALDPIFFMMNPRLTYEVTFLKQLHGEEVTCSSGLTSPVDVANHVQRIIAATLGFECTNFTRKDKYKILAGNDGTV